MHRKHPATRVRIPNGIRALVAQALAVEIHGEALAALTPTLSGCRASNASPQSAAA
jgi:hypothetical protein